MGGLQGASLLAKYSDSSQLSSSSILIFECKLQHCHSFIQSMQADQTTFHYHIQDRPLYHLRPSLLMTRVFIYVDINLHNICIGVQ